MIVMDYLDSVLDVVDSQAPTQDRSKKGIPWVKSFSFEAPGEFPFRLVSDETKCPRGMHPYCVHEVQTKPVPNSKMTKEEREKYYSNILCTLSTHGTIPVDTGRKDAQGKTIYASKLAEPCAVCDVYTDYQHTFGDWEGEPGKSKFLGIPETSLSKGIQDALEDMRQGTCMKYVFPALVRAKVTQNKEGFDNYVEGNDLHLVLLVLQPAKYGTDATLLKLINEARRGRPNFFNRETGNWCLYTRAKRNSTFTAEDPSPLGKTELELLKKYPDIMNWGKGVEGIAGSDKTMSYDQAMYSFEDCWWLKSTKRQYPDYTLASITPGLV